MTNSTGDDRQYVFVLTGDVLVRWTDWLVSDVCYPETEHWECSWNRQKLQLPSRSDTVLTTEQAQAIAGPNASLCAARQEWEYLFLTDPSDHTLFRLEAWGATDVWRPGTEDSAGTWERFQLHPEESATVPITAEYAQQLAGSGADILAPSQPIPADDPVPGDADFVRLREAVRDAEENPETAEVSEEEISTLSHLLRPVMRRPSKPPTAPMTMKWVFEVSSGTVTIEDNESRHPAFTLTLGEVRPDVTGADRLEGYIYNMVDFYRITNSDHEAVENQAAIDAIMAELNRKYPDGG